ncbi:MAG: TIGR00266 family protein [Clostridia bacterium]|nr:TIGR00266 family protein [Clostridia bacterium]
MKYEIKGGNLPYVELTLENGEGIKCQNGAMSWKTPNMQMKTSGGGLGKIFSKALTGEAMFHNEYSAVGGQGLIAFSSSFPGNIMAVEVTPGKEIVCQKSAFLAATSGVEIGIFFHKKLGAGFFGGEGFIMQKLSGTGLAFLEIDGSAETKVLGPGEQLIVDTGYLAMMDSTCSMDITAVGGVKNTLLGGEGFFNTVVTGPGKIVLQSMPASKLVSLISIPSSN